MITPAIGTMTFSERLRIMLNMPAFHPAGVVPTCVAISPTSVFTLSNKPERFDKNPVCQNAAKPIFNHLPYQKLIPSFPAPSRFREGAAGGICFRHYPKKLRKQGNKGAADQSETARQAAAAMSCFYPQIGVGKPARWRAAGRVKKYLWSFFKNRPGGAGQACDLLHFRDGF